MASLDMFLIGPRAGQLRRIVLLSLALGLSAAALTAIVGVLTRSFGDTDWRLIGTSLGFSVFSALGAAGSRARQRRGVVAKLGGCTVLAAGASFALLTVAIWNDGPVPLARSLGVLAMATLAASHACLILSSRRLSDTSLIIGLTVASIAAGLIDAVLGAVAISGAVDRVGIGYARAVAVLVIVLLLSSALPPILRRLRGTGQQSNARPAGQLTHAPSSQSAACAELDAVARRLDELAPEAGALAWCLQTDAAELRRIAHKLTTPS